MKISTRTRYGIRLMMALGLDYGRGAVFLKDIAKREDISEKYLSQIIIPLKARGLINSFRGAHGGYVLARDPSQINLKEIFEILEGDLGSVECVKHPSACSRVSICVTRDLWEKLTENISQTLSSITVEDLVKMYREKRDKVAMYNI